ncbi:hypothetical protein BASA81_012929 [Batrachochytrium salamandrivorans]|nr:hypothetical protein BASA81_012929 [Batrachochytrium salamandrivorans]
MRTKGWSLGLALVSLALVVNYVFHSGRTSSPSIATPSPTLSLASSKPLPMEWNREFDLWQVDYSQPVHFTHVFSSYTVDKDYKEAALVQYSWLRAAQYAKRVANIQVEFMDCTLSTDTASSPSFASRYNLTWLVPDIRGNANKWITTVGEYYKLAIAHGRGEFVLGTNMDIGVVEDFYVRAFGWASKDYASPEVQLQAMHHAAELYSICYFAPKRDSAHNVHQKLCVEDCKARFVSAGGSTQQWNLVKRDVALLAAKMAWLNSNERLDMAVLLQLAKALVSPSSVALGLTSKQMLANFQPAAPPRLPARVPFAGTITRLDLDLDLVLDDKTKSKELAYLKLTPSTLKQSDIHPGNDCFVFTRVGAPSTLGMFPHPNGLRPFGSWIPLLFTEAGIPFRRIAATSTEPWTFHVGKGLWGSQGQDKFKERVNANPLFFLFMGGNFNYLSKTRVLQWHYTKAPPVCLEHKKAYRQEAYCANTPGALCVGSMRLACERFQSPHLRDGQLYLKHCQALYNSNQAKAYEPVCSLCNFFFQIKSLERRFTCLRGKMDQFCKHLPDEACGHLRENGVSTGEEQRFPTTQQPVVKPLAARTLRPTGTRRPTTLLESAKLRPVEGDGYGEEYPANEYDEEEQDSLFNSSMAMVTAKPVEFNRIQDWLIQPEKQPPVELMSREESVFVFDGDNDDDDIDERDDEGSYEEEEQEGNHSEMLSLLEEAGGSV